MKTAKFFGGNYKHRENKEKEGKGLIVIQSVFKFFPKITEKFSVFQKMKSSLLEENLKYLKKLNISSQPHTSDFN